MIPGFHGTGTADFFSAVSFHALVFFNTADATYRYVLALPFVCICIVTPAYAQ
jgi:hypothetical protein